MSVTLRPPDIVEETPDTTLPRSVRLHNLIRFQLRGDDTVALLHWVSSPPSGAPDELSPGHWVVWLDQPAPKADPLRQAGVSVPATRAVVADAS
jgi:hypothetical protein